ncbi:MAG: Gfo/Idh/MocA family oxidoreductase [Ruminococcaceae bacterium]|nr:Gfo/Idh/MocA family oxidoreductase [Oscillospiraceae bacterium]
MKERKATMQYRIGYIGFGGMASGYHYDTAMREDVPFTPTAVFDLRESQRNLAKSRGLAAFDNLQDFLDSRLFDFVLVATPNQYHCPMVCAALDSGYHAMSEKPAAMSSAEVEQMIAHSKAAGKMFTVHHNRRWDRDYLILREALASGKIGRVHSYENRIHSAGGNGQMFGWRNYADHGGGMLLDWGIHMLDQTLDLIREPVKSVFADVRPIRSEVDDWAKLLIRFESGVTAQMEVSTFSPIPLPKWMAFGDKGTIVVDECCGDKGRMRYVENAHGDARSDTVYPDSTVAERGNETYTIDEWVDAPLPLTPQPQDWASLYKNVAASLDGTEALRVTPESVLRCFRVIEAAFQSAESGVSVEF